LVRTSSRLSTTGSRAGSLARNTPSSRPNFLSKIVGNKNKSAQKVLCRSRYFPLHSQITGKLNNLFFCELTGMPFTVKKNEAPDPIYVCLFGSPAVASCPHKSAHHQGIWSRFALAFRVGWRPSDRFCRTENQFKPEKARKWLLRLTVI
jgi:hypothetical protein